MTKTRRNNFWSVAHSLIQETQNIFSTNPFERISNLWVSFVSLNIFTSILWGHVRFSFSITSEWGGVTIFWKCFIFGHICSQQSWFKQLSLTYHCKQIFPSNLFSSLTFIPTLHFTKWRLLQSFKPKWILQEVTQFKGTPKPNTS